MALHHGRVTCSSRLLTESTAGVQGNGPMLWLNNERMAHTHTTVHVAVKTRGQTSSWEMVAVMTHMIYGRATMEDIV